MFLSKDETPIDDCFTNGSFIMLYSEKNNMQQLTKPEKVYLENTNLMYALAPTSDIGNIRETFFANQLKANHTITFSGQGDFRIDDLIHLR